MLAVVAIAAALRLYQLDRKSIWYDEGVSLGMVRLSLSEFLSYAWGKELNMALYHLLLRPWHAALGEGEGALRTLSILFSLGSIAAVYALGRRMFGATTGLLAAILLSLHAFDARYAQEARAYSLATFLCVISTLLLVRLVERPTRARTAAWIAASALSLYAHFFCGLVITAQVLSLPALGRERLGARWRPFAAGLSGIALVALPIAVYLRRAPALLAWVHPTDWGLVGDVASDLAGSQPWLLPVYALVFVTLLRGCVRAGAEARWKILLVASWALIPMVVALLASIWRPVVVTRYLTISAPAWTLAAAIVITRTLSARGWRSALAVAALVSMIALESVAMAGMYREWYEDWREAAFAVARDLREGDAIFFDSPWSQFAFDYYGERFTSPEYWGRFTPPGSGLLRSAEDDVREAANHERVWVVASRAKCRDCVAVLGQRLIPVRRFDLAENSISVILYASPRAR